MSDIQTKLFALFDAAAGLPGVQLSVFEIFQPEASLVFRQWCILRAVECETVWVTSGETKLHLVRTLHHKPDITIHIGVSHAPNG